MNQAVFPVHHDVDAVRRFNRFYTRQIGILDEGLANSPFSLTEARILFELAHTPGMAAADLVRDLGLDAGYLSRILKKFEEHGFLLRRVSASDARQTLLALSDAGLDAFRPLERASNRDVAAMLDRLGAYERAVLVNAMAAIERLLAVPPEPSEPFSLRPLRPGDIGWIAHRQGLIYHLDYGWDQTYEALVATILGDFVKDFKPERENAWIAERDGAVVGSVFCMEKSDEVARLRLLYVEPDARGLGLGARLVAECMAFARATGYRRLDFWTNDILISARRIYEAAGFQLVKEAPHRSFGHDLVGQDWTLDLMA